MTLHLENMSLIASTNCMNEGTWESRVLTRCGARITQANDKHTRTLGGFEISFTEYAKEISLIAITTTPRRKVSCLNFDSPSVSCSLGMQCLPQLLAPLSLLMGHKPQATVDTICEVNKLARKATVWAKMPLKVHAHHSLAVVTHTDAGWTTRPDGTSQGGHHQRRVAARQRIKHVSDILALESSETRGKIVICSRNSSSSRRR